MSALTRAMTPGNFTTRSDAGLFSTRGPRCKRATMLTDNSAMHTEFSRSLTAAVDSMPAFPNSVQRIFELTRHMECSAKDVVQVIEKDPVLTVKILRVVNAAHYNLPKPINSIKHAVVYLGFNTIKNLALAIAAIGILPAHVADGFDGRMCLLHSLSTAGVARQLALAVKGADPMDCFVAGLLLDFGHLVLAQYMPEEFGRALAASQREARPLHLALREFIGADPGAVGAMLAEKWRFPTELVDTIRYQHEPELKDTPVVGCVVAASHICKKLQFGFSGESSALELPPVVARRLGGTLDQVIDRLGDLTAVFDEAKSFSRVQ